MAVPVQTWGSLGTMVPEQTDFGRKTAEYLEQQEVYDLFAHMLRQVVINQPDNPIKFLQDQLRGKPPLAVCIVGPPGINRSKYCQQLAGDYKVKHIHVGKLLRLRKDLKDTIDSGVLVSDDIVIGVVKAELGKNKGSGWVLDGFPRTKVQAQALALKETGFCLDKVLLLHTGEKAIRARFALKVASMGGVGPAEQEDLINVRLQQYQRHIISIAELFKNVIKQIEVSTGDDDQNVVYNVIRSNLHVRPSANAPLRSHRACLVGPPSSGRTTQCGALARHYGLVHVDVARLLRKHQKASGRKVEEIPLEYMGDEELCAVVGKRLNEVDCLRKGWLLDGFPKTGPQAEFLRQAHLWPTRVLHLKLEEDEVLARSQSRRVDPVTGLAFYRTPSNPTLADRLIQADYDQPEKISARYYMHMDGLEKVNLAFPGVSASVKGGDEIADVTKALQEKIDSAEREIRSN